MALADLKKMYKCNQCGELCQSWLALCPHCRISGTLEPVAKEKKTKSIRAYSTTKHRKRTPVKKVAESRKPKEALYKKERDVRKANDKRTCFFCANRIKGDVEHHHLLGRIGKSDDGVDLLYYAPNIVDSHPGCHNYKPNSYHMTMLHELPEKPYFKRMIRRMYGVSKQKTNLLILHINDSRLQEQKQQIQIETYL